MALVLADRVEQVTRTTGLADLTLAEVIRGRQSFQAVTNNGDTVIYVLEDSEGVEWEIGEGTVVHGTETTLQRTTIRQSSNADNKISLSAGTHRVFLVADASYLTDLTTSAELAQAIADHEAKADPHPQYTTTAEASAAAPVQSVNGETGTVLLDAADVGAAPSSHVGSGGAQHADATTTVAGFMSGADKTKLDTVETNAKDDQSAAEVPYTNGTSGLAATDVQAALDEVDGDLDQYKTDLASNATGDGSDLVAHTGTTDTVTEALDKRTIRVGSVAELEALSLAVGTNVYLTEEGRAGEFVVKTGAPPSDTYKGIHIALANGNYAERIDKVNITPEMYGALGDNVQNDWPRALAAFNFAKANGKRLIFNPSKTYYLGAFPATGQEIKFDIDVDNFRLETNGCTFRVDVSLDASHAANSDQLIVQINNASGAWVGDFDCIGDVIQRTPTRIGYIALNVLNSTANTEGLTIGKINAVKSLAAVQATTTDPALYRHKGARIDRAFNSGGYYGINCADNIDDLEFSVRTDDCVRSYFVYGVDNHKGLISSKDHAFFSDVVISRYVRDTCNIDILYDAENDLSADESLSYQFVTNDTNAVIQDVSVELNVQKSNAANNVIGFRAFDGASNPLSTTTNQYKDIKISGSSNASSDSSLQLVSGMTGAARSNININRELFGRTQNTKGYIISVADSGHIATADSSTDLELDFKVPDATFANPIVAKIRLAAFDNATGSTSEYFATDLWVLFSVPADGSVSIVATADNSTFTGGTLGPTYSIPAQPAGTYSLKVKVNNYTGANRFVKGFIDTFSFQEG